MRKYLVCRPPVSAAEEELRMKSSLFVWIYSKDEVEEMEFVLVRKNRSFPFGEGEGGWGLLNKDDNVQESRR